MLLLISCWVVGLLGCWVVGLLGRRRHRHRRFCRCCGVVGFLSAYQPNANFMSRVTNSFFAYTVGVITIWTELLNRSKASQLLVHFLH